MVLASTTITTALLRSPTDQGVCGRTFHLSMMRATLSFVNTWDAQIALITAKGGSGSDFATADFKPASLTPTRIAICLNYVDLR
jgi:hypothetical protein